MVEEGVLQRRMEMGHYSQVLAVLEIHHDGFVVIGIPPNGVPLAVGDEVLLCGKSTCQRVVIEDLQINNQSVAAMILAPAAFVSIVAVFWKHNHSTYQRQYAHWNQSFICERCGTVSRHDPPTASLS
jgi:hypothetical protein